MKLIDFIEKIQTQDVYTFYAFENVALKFPTGGSRDVTVNTGDKKYTVDSGETIAVDGRLEGVEITEKEFNNFQSKK